MKVIVPWIFRVALYMYRGTYRLQYRIRYTSATYSEYLQLSSTNHLARLAITSSCVGRRQASLAIR